ncbi:hypothetical protein DPMN_046822 [Dreissena polymorpha]|uniref:Uncharacterized protein n=1 Tax=Dreissena polymorpha TaxID=45954 RepID=A0A9D4D8L2_DREPO|nr:hypothetical protein DPMN_046822 [Dreissena polymorpha]
MALLLVCGDVESNSGPPKSEGSRNPATTSQTTRPGTGAAQGSQGVIKRQMSISTFTKQQNQQEGSCYFNDQDEKNGISQMFDNLETITNNYPQALLYIAGDLNSRCKDFLDYIPFDDLF